MGMTGRIFIWVKNLANVGEWGGVGVGSDGKGVEEPRMVVVVVEVGETEESVENI